jgi:GNAT superfamily N-acetyltransferase
LGDHDQPSRTDLHDGPGRIGSDPATLDRWSIACALTGTEADLAYRWLSQESYWAAGLPRAVFDRAIDNSLMIVLKDPDGRLRGIARVITDRATFAYLCDVFIDPACRGQGIGQWLMARVFDLPDLRDLRRILLATRDAHRFYEKFGFTTLAQPENLMHRHDPEVYQRLSRAS